MAPFLPGVLSIRFFWTTSQAQLYPRLERLERAGLVHGRAIEPATQLAQDEGNRHPLLTLRMGIAYHHALIDRLADR